MVSGSAKATMSPTPAAGEVDIVIYCCHPEASDCQGTYFRVRGQKFGFVLPVYEQTLRKRGLQPGHYTLYWNNQVFLPEQGTPMGQGLQVLIAVHTLEETSKSEEEEVVVIQGGSQRQHGAFGDLYEAKVFSDLELQCDDGETFMVHKVVLSAWSPYFLAMLSSGMQESEASRARCTGYPSDIVATFLEFIYKGSASVAVSQLYRLYCLADQYRVKCLLEALGQFFQEGQTLHVGMQVYEAAKCGPHERVTEACLATFAHHLGHLMHHGAFLDTLEPEDFVTVLSTALSSHLSVEPLLALAVANKWAEGRPERLAGIGEQLVGLCGFTSMELKELDYVRSTYLCQHSLAVMRGVMEGYRALCKPDATHHPHASGSPGAMQGGAPGPSGAHQQRYDPAALARSRSLSQ